MKYRTGIDDCQWRVREERDVEDDVAEWFGRFTVGQLTSEGGLHPVLELSRRAQGEGVRGRWEDELGRSRGQCRLESRRTTQAKPIELRLTIMTAVGPFTSRTREWVPSTSPEHSAVTS